LIQISVIINEMSVIQDTSYRLYRPKLIFAEKPTANKVLKIKTKSMSIDINYGYIRSRA